MDEAYAGDIIGFTTHGGVQLGDTITDGPGLRYTGFPFFAPEMFMTVVLKNPLRTKQLQQGLAQLGEEGAIQVFKPEAGGNMLPGRRGPLQFEVVQHRLKTGTTPTFGWKAASTLTRAGSPPTSPVRPVRIRRRLPCAWRGCSRHLAYLCQPYDVRLARERPKIHFHRCVSTPPGWPCRTPDDAFGAWGARIAVASGAYSPTLTTRSPPAPSRPCTAGADRPARSGVDRYPHYRAAHRFGANASWLAVPDQAPWRVETMVADERRRGVDKKLATSPVKWTGVLSKTVSTGCSDAHGQRRRHGSRGGPGLRSTDSPPHRRRGRAQETGLARLPSTTTTRGVCGAGAGGCWSTGMHR